ncbi:sterol desaturase family protein [Nodularia sp. UHCC 0506]|uniref:sterol desaturase family protein n=1 Tax=Nodularia sp. UHCC 0506 TaxID=3110243 RepID=UPI002B1EB8F1|nr:sterol desaturase family protein [Nodularia sp. UHCC 0506]MEA5513955.1 sterol desaturase family protein [Nodularia sp. UHCC 0506]
MEWIDYVSIFVKYVLQGLLMYGVFMLIERLRPAEPNQPFRHILFNLKWYIVYTLLAFLMNAIGIATLVELTRTWLGGAYLTFPEPRNWIEAFFGVILYLLIVDFFYYWFHRCQHTNSFLWEQHKFHHSEVSLNVTSSRRLHWLEEPLVLLFIVLPMTLLFNLQPIPAGFLAFIQVLWLQFIHMNLRLGVGKLSPIIVSPQYHRIHHSYQPEHIDKNYAVFFPIWDIIFGSYYHPPKGEFPPTGLTTGETHNHLWEAAILPFKEWLKLIKPRKQKPEKTHF